MDWLFHWLDLMPWWWRCNRRTLAAQLLYSNSPSASVTSKSVCLDYCETHIWTIFLNVINPFFLRPTSRPGSLNWPYSSIFGYLSSLIRTTWLKYDSLLFSIIWTILRLMSNSFSISRFRLLSLSETQYSAKNRLPTSSCGALLVSKFQRWVIRWTVIL